MPRKDGRKGPRADFWREPSAHPIELCRELTFHPLDSNAVCIGALTYIMRAEGLTMDDLFTPQDSEPAPESETLFTQGAPNA